MTIYARSLGIGSRWKSKQQLTQSRSSRCNSLSCIGEGGVRSPALPYGTFFEMHEHRIVVIACFHGRRNPRRWQVR